MSNETTASSYHWTSNYTLNMQISALIPGKSEIAFNSPSSYIKILYLIS